MGYEPTQLKFSGNMISLPIRSNDSDMVKNLADCIRDWLEPATTNFNQHQRSEYNRQKQEKASKLQAEIESLRIEAQVRTELNSVL
jgi:hypothetical protein